MVRIFDPVVPATLTTDQLAERLVGYASQVAALTARFLDYLAEFDTRHGWSGHGILSCAHWLSWKTGLSRRTAQEHVRVAHALQELPVMRSAFAAGTLSYSKIRALTRVATVEREEELVRFSHSATAAQVERICAAMRTVDRNLQEGADDQERERPPESGARWRWNDDGSLTVSVKLNAVDGAHLLAAIVRAEYERTRTANDPELPSQPDLWANVPCNIAPALVAMADAVIAGIAMPQIAPGAEILVHEVDGVPSLDHGPQLRSVERDEAECGAAIRTVGHAAGAPVDETGDHDDGGVQIGGTRLGPVLRWGRRRRVPTAALVRVVAMRDRGCRAPGCGRTRHLHIHHVMPWSAGGTTDPDNLIMLCSQHHRQLHQGEFSIESLGGQRFAFRGTGGQPLEEAPIPELPAGWSPWDHVATCAVTPTDPGRLSLDYATAVLYAAWEWKRRQRPASTEVPAAA